MTPKKHDEEVPPVHDVNVPDWIAKKRQELTDAAGLDQARKFFALALLDELETALKGEKD